MQRRPRNYAAEIFVRLPNRLKKSQRLRDMVKRSGKAAKTPEELVWGRKKR